MNYLWLLLIPYCTLTFGIHGGEGVSGIDRQVRNLICALPFALVGWLSSLGWEYGLGLFILSYIGVNMGFDKWPLWFKGLITFPPLGAVILPIAYSINTKWKNVFQEYFSGTLFGVALYLVRLLYK